MGLALNRLRIVITPILNGLAVFVVGLQLGIVGIGKTPDVSEQSARPRYFNHGSISVWRPRSLLPLWPPGFVPRV